MSEHNVQYVAETPSMPQLAASTLMMLNYRGNPSYSVSELLGRLAEIGINRHDPNEIDRLVNPLSINLLSEACSSAADWARALDRGPIMVGMPSHVFVVAGVENEEDEGSARLKILDPTQGGETWMGYGEVVQRYELGVGYPVKLFQWP